MSGPIKIDYAPSERMLAYMHAQLVEQTKQKLIDVLVQEQAAAFEANLRARTQELLADLTVKDIYSVKDTLGDRLLVQVMWNSKTIVPAE